MCPQINKQDPEKISAGEASGALALLEVRVERVERRVHTLAVANILTIFDSK